MSTHPPGVSGAAASSGGLTTFLRSIVHNSPTLAQETSFLVFANDHNEEVELTAQLKFPPWFSRRLHFDNFQVTLGNASVIDVHKFPEKIRCLAPAPFSNINDIVRYSGIWRSLKRAYGAMVAISVLNARHVLVTDPDGFAWKDLSAADIIRHSRAGVWFSDHRGTGGQNPKLAVERPPKPDTTSRARQFCSLHPWAAAFHVPGWEEHGARMAIGRDWASWEQASELLLPAPDADVADDAMLVLDAKPFHEMVHTIETHWRAPLAEAVLLALTTPGTLYKHCVRGDVFFLELTYRSYLFHRRHRPSSHKDTNPITFLNATARIEAHLPVAALPVGYAYRSSTPLPEVTRNWYHASPSGYSRLWLHVKGGNEPRNGHDEETALRELYTRAPGPLVAFRHDFGAIGNLTHACAVMTAVLRLSAPAAALQLSSGPIPAELWRTCESLRAARVGGPFVVEESLHQAGGSAVSPANLPRYIAHRSEWVPSY